ncbi:MAG: hypothetical protein KJ799_10230, partial [Bacteroidetes bacterium]|nr:hypothetical protein [Bacteroidota bacterium]
LKRKRLTSINKIPLERQKLRNPAMRESDSKRIQTEDAQWETKSKELFQDNGLCLQYGYFHKLR